MESHVNSIASETHDTPWRRLLAIAAILAATAVVAAACRPSDGDAPPLVAPPLMTLTAAAGVSAVATSVPGDAGEAPRGVPEGVAAMQTVVAQTGVDPNLLPGDEAGGIQNADIGDGGVAAADVAFRQTQEAQSADANIADVNALVARQVPLATFTPPASPPKMAGKLLFVRGAKFYVKNADGTGQHDLAIEDKSMPPVWAPPEDPGRAWLSPDGDEVAFFAGTDAAMWRMGIDGRNNHAVLDSSVPDEAHQVGVGGAAQSIKLRPGLDYTLVHTPGGKATFGVLVDDNDYHIRGEARLRVVHAARGAADTPLSVLINGQQAGNAAAYGGSIGEERVTTGAVVIELQDAGGKRIALLPSFDVPDKDVRTVFVSGGDALAMIGYSYPSGTRSGAGEARVRVFNGAAQPIDVTLDGAETAMRGIAPGTLSDYVPVPGVLSRDARQDVEIALYGLAAGDEPIAWSPDSESLAFVAAPTGNMDLYVSKGKGAAVRVSDDLERETMPRWSPDSKRLVWMSIDVGFGENRVSVWDGAKVTALDLSPIRNGGQVPASAGLYYPLGANWLDNEHVFLYPAAGVDKYGIWVADVTTGAIEQVYDGPIEAPDYSLAAGAWLFSAGETGGLVKLTKDGRSTTLSEAAYGARWSPDGKTITYSEGEPLDSDGWRLHAMSADGKNDRVLNQERLPIMQESPPVPGPNAKRFWIDDDRLAITRVGRDYGMRDRQGVMGSAEAGRDIENIYAVSLNGRGDIQQLSDMMKAFYINQITPSPDGKVLAFIGFSYINRAQQLYTMPATGGKPVQIDGAVRWYAWLP